MNTMNLVNCALFKLYFKLQGLMEREEGQDLIEYALIAALISVGAIATINSISTGIGTLFNKINSAVA